MFQVDQERSAVGGFTGGRLRCSSIPSPSPSAPFFSTGCSQILPVLPSSVISSPGEIEVLEGIYSSFAILSICCDLHVNKTQDVGFRELIHFGSWSNCGAAEMPPLEMAKREAEVSTTIRIPWWERGAGDGHSPSKPCYCPCTSAWAGRTC